MSVRGFVLGVVSRGRGRARQPEPTASAQPTPPVQASAEACVDRWVPVSLRWLGHRAEPLITERLGGYDVPLDDETLARQEYWAEAGFDADGGPVARRQVSRHSGAEAAEVAVREADGTIKVELKEGGVARTFFDPSGRASRTTYEGVDSDRSEETYVYDDAGRLVAIEESDEIGFTEICSVERYNMGGRVQVVHDHGGLAKIVARDGEIVWDRPGRPRPERIAELVDAMATSCLAALADAVAHTEFLGRPEAYGLAVSYSAQGRLYLNAAVGLEEDRVDAGSGEDGAISTLYLDGDLNAIEIPIADQAGGTMMREIALVQPEDPYRAAAEALARRLSDTDLPGITKTPAFVAWAADVDEGLAEKVISIKQCNGPDRLERWKAGWGGEVLPYIDDALPVGDGPGETAADET